MHNTLQELDLSRFKLVPPLLPDESPNLVFSRRGVVTHHLFGNILRKLGLEPPLSFQMTWNEQSHCWVDEYEGITAPPPAVTCPVGRRKHRTRRSAV